uniref:Uncharacterized protein n=1 Tax=Meloidogyne enterolobii TaxID=390850 RepID=A0A6V7VA78_MELEN|nr:unnamed protein product [Meloidogyne enterolobii]
MKLRKNYNYIKLLKRMWHSVFNSKFCYLTATNNNQRRRAISSIFSTTILNFLFIIFLINNIFLSVNIYCQIQQTHNLEKLTKFSSSMPVIGGLCHLDSQDVHIGGKQTQFFLRCEPISESLPGEGVWVVKSKNVGSNAPRISAAALIKSEQQQIRKTSPKMSSYICDLVSDAHEHGFCSVSENCLQPVYTDRNAFLQCDSTTRRWHKKHCQPSFNFDFERQACIAHTVVKQGHHHFRQFPAIQNFNSINDSKYIDIICLNTLCSKNDPCYCCFFKNQNVPEDQDNLTTNHTTFNVFHLLGAKETIQNYQNQNKFKEKQQQLLSTNQKPSLILFYEIKNIPQNNILKHPTEPEPTTNLLNDFNKELEHRRVPKWLQIPDENYNQQKIRLRKRIGRSCFCNDCLPCMPFSFLAADSDMLPMNLLTNNINNNFCPGGGPPIASCSTTGFCAPPMQCLQPGICCVMPQVLSPPSPLQQNYACPGGLPVLGQCIAGRCMSPAVCSTPANVCCAQATAIPATGF